MTMPENTSRRDPLLHLLGATGTGGISTYVEEMESAGQAQLVNSDVLPVDVTPDDAAFQALGFEFGPPLDSDPLFRQAVLPAGWTRRGSDHAMWSYIDDEQGRERVAVFYKAAFYDRRAHMSLVAADRAVR